MPFHWRKREEEPSRLLIYHTFLHARDPLASCGALFIFISPLPLSPLLLPIMFFGKQIALNTMHKNLR